MSKLNTETISFKQFYEWIKGDASPSGAAIHVIRFSDAAIKAYIRESAGMSNICVHIGPAPSLNLIYHDDSTINVFIMQDNGTTNFFASAGLPAYHIDDSMVDTLTGIIKDSNNIASSFKMKLFDAVMHIDAEYKIIEAGKDLGIFPKKSDEDEYI